MRRLKNYDGNSSSEEPRLLADNIIVFVNTKSGSRDGPNLIKKFKKYLGDSKVFDLSQGGPEPGYINQHK